ncbi:hypothetical protein [Spirobacillus cienkowskii]|uniref:hypothetical protein n=1 Tax=Spirobacillus cienkowskii TaxID=495820 RepID=UPI0030D4A850
MPNFKKIFPILIGTSYLFFGCGNRTSSSSNNRSDIIDTVTFSAKLSKDNIGDSKIDDNSLNIIGKYYGCFGKVDNSEWNLSKNSGNLVFLKDDKNCKIKFSKIQVKNDKEVENYIINGESDFIGESYQDKPIEFVFSSEKKFYVLAKISPLDLSSEPTISVSIFEKNLNKNDIHAKLNIQEDSVNVMMPSLKLLNIFQPDYKLKEKNLLPIKGSSNNVLYDGDLIFESKNVPSKFYIIVPGNEDTSSDDKVNALINAAKTNNSYQIINSELGKNEVSIPLKYIAHYAQFPNKLEKSDKLDAKIIFVNEHESPIGNVYQIITLSLSLE